MNLSIYFHTAIFRCKCHIIWESLSYVLQIFNIFFFYPKELFILWLQFTDRDSILSLFFHYIICTFHSIAVSFSFFSLKKRWEKLQFHSKRELQQTIARKSMTYNISYLEYSFLLVDIIFPVFCLTLSEERIFSKIVLCAKNHFVFRKTRTTKQSRFVWQMVSVFI